MPSKNEPKFAFTALADREPPPEAYRTADQWEALLAEGERIRTGNPNADLVTKTLDHDKIWARYNAKAGGIQRVVPAKADE